MSVPIPPPDPRDETPPLWRRLISLLPLAIWPVGGFFLLLGSAAGEESPLGQGFIALVLSWGLDPATTVAAGTPLWGCLLFFIGVSLIDAGHTIQERRACPPPRSGNGA